MTGRMTESISMAMSVLREVQASRWFKRLGYAVALVSLSLLGWIVLSEYQAVKNALSHASPVWLLVAISLNFLGHGILALNWHQMLKRSGHPLPLDQLFRIYFLTGIARYLPGGVWHFGGRVMWLNRLSVPLGASTRTVTAEQVAVLAVALIAGSLSVSLTSLPSVLHRMLAAFLCLLLLVAASTILTWTLQAGVRPDRWSRLQSLGQIILYLVFWIGYGLSIYALIIAIRYPFHSVDPSRIIGYAAISWAVGYLLLFVPGGLGVREGVLTVLLSLLLPPSVASTIALLARLASTIPELIWAAALVKIHALPH